MEIIFTWILDYKIKISITTVENSGIDEYKENKMKKFVIDDYSNIADAMFNEIVNREKEEAAFVGFYEDAIEVIKELLMNEEVMPCSIEIQPEFIAGYDKEYYVFLNDELEVWCQPAWYEEGKFYLMTDVDITFIMGECNSSILKTIRTEETVEVTFELDNTEDCSECCGECCCGSTCEDEESNELSDSEITTRILVDEDGKLRGFSKTWESEEDGMHLHTYYEHYSNSEELLKRLIKEFNI